MEKQTYRVKEGHRFGRHYQHGPGAKVELTEREANGFLDKLELVDGEKKKESLVIDAETLAGATEKQVRKWLETKPDPKEAQAILEAELAGKNRKGVVDALTEYVG